MKEKKLTLYSMAKFITREVILQEQIHLSDAFRTRLFENYKKSQKFLRNKILTTKISGATIFGVLPIIPLITYLKIIQFLKNSSISIEIIMFGGSILFSIFFLVQFFNFFLLAMINTTMIMSGKSFEWYESLPISRERLKKLVLFAIFRSLDLPIIVILTAFPIIMFIGTLDVVLLLICSGVSLLNFIFSFFILLLFAERINRIMDINEINSKKAILIRLFNMFSYIFIVVGSVYFIQWISNSLDTFLNLFLNYEYPALINLVLTIIPFPLNSGYIISLFIKPNQVSFQLWLNSFLGLILFIILIRLIYKKSLEWLDPTVFSKYKPIKKSFLSDNDSILVKIKTTSPIIAYLRKDLIIMTRDLKIFTSLIMPIFLSFVFTFSYSFINIGGIFLLDREIILNWLFLVGFNLIISGIIVSGILNIEDANETIRASLPIIPRDQAKAKLIVIFFIQTLSVISPILLFITNSAFIDILMTFLGILPFSWLFLFIMFEMRIILFSRMRNHYVTEETFPENKIIKWIIIFITVYLLFICIFYILVYIYFTEGITNAVTFSITVFIIGFISIILIFNNLFPDIRNVKKIKKIFNPFLRTYLLELRLRWKRVLFFSIVSVVFVFLFSFFYPYHFDEGQFFRYELDFFRFFIIFVSCFFFSDIVCSEFDKKTGYILFPKINRNKLIVGKYLANLSIIILLVILHYLMLDISVWVIYDTVIPESYISLGIAIFYTIALTGLLLLFSTIMPKAHLTTIVVILIYLVGFPVLEQVLTAINQEIEPIFSLNYIGNLIKFTIPGYVLEGIRWDWVHYAGDLLPPVKVWRMPTMEVAILIMSLYTALSFLFTFLALKRKEL